MQIKKIQGFKLIDQFDDKKLRMVANTDLMMRHWRMTTNKEKSYQVDNLGSNIKFLFYQQMKK